MNEPAPRSPHRSDALIYSLLFCLLVALRLPVAHRVVSEGTDMVDELNLTLSGVDRFIGVPFTNVHWPGMVNQFLLVPTVGTDFLFASHFAPTPAAFIDYLANVYREPWHVLWLARILVVVVIAAGFTGLAAALSAYTGRRWEPVMGVVALTSLASLWPYTYWASADGMAIGLFALATAAAIVQPPPGGRGSGMPVLAGAFMGLVLASRTTFFPGVLLPAAFLWMNSGERRWRNLVIFGFATAVCQVAACPSWWVEPVRFLKAGLGNYRKQGTPIGWWDALQVMRQAAPVWFWILGALAVGYGFVSRQTAPVVATLVMGLFMLTAAARSPFVQPHYFTSVVLATGVLIVLALALISGAVSARFQRLYSRLGVGLLALATLGGVYATVTGSRPADSFTENARQVRAALPALAGQRIAVPLDFFSRTANQATNAALRGMAERLESALAGGQSVAPYLRSYGFSAAVASALALDFNEKDQAMEARLRVMAASSRPGQVELAYFSPDSDAGRNGVLTTAEVLAQLEHGELDGIIGLTTAPAFSVRTTTLGENLTFVRRPTAP